MSPDCTLPEYSRDRRFVLKRRSWLGNGNRHSSRTPDARIALVTRPRSKQQELEKESRTMISAHDSMTRLNLKTSLRTSYDKVTAIRQAATTGTLMALPQMPFNRGKEIPDVFAHATKHQTL